MALHIVKLPFISRCCDSTNSTLLFLSKSYSPLHGRWFKSHMNSPFRSFAVSKSEKLQIPKKKKRLDELCLERFQQYSRTFIQSWILQGKVYVNGKVVNKAGTPVSDKAVVEIIAEIPKYVCRAGYKLEAAIEQLGVDVAGKIALDSGLSTGGFTDCLLQYGASYVHVSMDMFESNTQIAGNNGIKEQIRRARTTPTTSQARTTPTTSHARTSTRPTPISTLRPT